MKNIQETTSVAKDIVFEELCRRTMDPGFDVLACEWLETISCTCTLELTNKLADQLLVVRLYQPTNEVIDKAAVQKDKHSLKEIFCPNGQDVSPDAKYTTMIVASGVIVSQ